MSELEKTNRTSITRLPKRGSYNADTIHSILDEAYFCTLSYVREGTAFQIPTGFVRIGEKLYIHGSVGSFYMRELASAKPLVSIGVMLVDGMVLARSAFHHSVNYRSVVLFGRPELVTDEVELYNALEQFTEKICPGRWADIRKPDKGEWKATMVLSFAITEASAKIRSGAPKDDATDYDLDIWAGVIPTAFEMKAPVPDPDLKSGVELPEYLKDVGKQGS